jgi:hypothetical protein
MRFNMAGERAAIKVQLQHRRVAASPTSVIELTDDDDNETVITPVRHMPIMMKRPHDESGDVRPSQRLHLHSRDTSLPEIDFSPCSSPTTPSRLSPTLSFPLSPSSPPQNHMIFIPTTGKWPAGMYTCDMKLAFEQVGSKALKRTYPLLPARLSFVLGKSIHVNTWRDQVSLWTKEASEQQRNEYSARGRVNEGLWAAFRKAVRS